MSGGSGFGSARAAQVGYAGSKVKHWGILHLWRRRKWVIGAAEQAPGSRADTREPCSRRGMRRVPHQTRPDKVARGLWFWAFLSVSPRPRRPLQWCLPQPSIRCPAEIAAPAGETPLPHDARVTPTSSYPYYYMGTPTLRIIRCTPNLTFVTAGFSEPGFHSSGSRHLESEEIVINNTSIKNHRTNNRSMLNQMRLAGWHGSGKPRRFRRS